MRTLKQVLVVAAVLLLIPSVVWGQAAPGATFTQGSPQLLDAAIAAAHSHTTGATITITVPQNQFAYILGMDVSQCQTGSAVTGGAPIYITTTGISGSPQYQIGTGAASAGSCTPTINFAFNRPLKSQTAGTNVTYVLPSFTTNTVISVNVYYYLGP